MLTEVIHDGNPWSRTCSNDLDPLIYPQSDVNIRATDSGAVKAIEPCGPKRLGQQESIAGGGRRPGYIPPKSGWVQIGCSLELKPRVVGGPGYDRVASGDGDIQHWWRGEHYYVHLVWLRICMAVIDD